MPQRMWDMDRNKKYYYWYRIGGYERSRTEKEGQLGPGLVASPETKETVWRYLLGDKD